MVYIRLSWQTGNHYRHEVPAALLPEFSIVSHQCLISPVHRQGSSSSRKIVCVRAPVEMLLPPFDHLHYQPPRFNELPNVVEYTCYMVHNSIYIRMVHPEVHFPQPPFKYLHLQPSRFRKLQRQKHLSESFLHSLQIYLHSGTFSDFP
jgi:hypothetical protein